MTRDWRERNSFNRIHLIGLLVVEVAMKTSVGLGWIVTFEYGVGVSFTTSVVRVGIAALCGITTCALLQWRLTRPLERWRTRPTDEGLRAASHALHRLPRRVAAAWVIDWFGCFTVLFLTSPVEAPLAAAGFFLLAMAVGPIVVAHSLVVWLAAPLARQISNRARERRIELAERPVTLRGRLTLYILCLGAAPSSYVSALALMARLHVVHGDSLFANLGACLIAVGLYGILCAVLIAAALSEPLAAMAHTMRSIIHRGAVTETDRVPSYSHDELGAMSSVTNQMLDRLGETEAERHRVAQSLAVLNQTLERRVADRTIALERRTADMRLVLDNVAEGMFVVDAAGAIAGEHSALLAAWFGAPRAGEPCWDYLGRTVPELGLRMRMGWEQLADGFLPLEVALDQMPRQVRSDGRDLDITYRLIGADVADGLLVVIEDVTARVEREAAERDKREAFAAFKHMAANRRAFVGFLDEGAQLLAVVRSPDTPLPELKRALHTLKGTSLLFGIESLAACCHTLESELQEHGTAPAASVAALHARWDGLAAEIDSWLGERRTVIELEPAQLAALEHAVATGARPDAVLDALHELRLEPAQRRLDHFAEQARRIAARLDKQIEIETTDESVRVDPQVWAPIWNVLVHAVRNAVDHGLEPAGERVRCGKPPHGRVVLRARRGPGVAVIEIEDDGRGIAWDGVRARAVALGVPSTTSDDLVAALFTDGLSTAAEVSDLSGRGVGLGALRAEVLAGNGTIEVTSTPGQGTRLRVIAPATRRPAASAAASSPGIDALAPGHSPIDDAGTHGLVWQEAR